MSSMGAPTYLEKPKPALCTKSSFSSEKQLRDGNPHSAGDEFDPCQNAKICSPFYLYNHDSPRPSADGRQPSKQSIHVSVRDLELGDLSPTVTQEKACAQNQKDSRFKIWCRQKQCLTKPKERRWLHKLSKRQRLMVKLLLALFIIGIMVGVAVGIAAAVHSSVNGSNKQLGD